VTSRRADVFFYGLFMDAELLRSQGVRPEGGELASVAGFALRIGHRAALVPRVGARVYGLVFSLTLSDLKRLYADPSVRAYVPQPVLAELAGGGVIPALCYNLPQPPATTERNPEYLAQLRALGQRVGLPAEYLESIQ